MAVNKQKYETKKWVSVGVMMGTLGPFEYAFPSNCPSTQATDFGHVDLTATTALVIIGSRYPKPRRASGFATDGSCVSSFIRNDKIAAAKTAGYTMSKARTSLIMGSTANTVALQVDLGAYGYGWRCSKGTYSLITDSAQASALGITEVTTETDAKKNVTGARFPYPAKYEMTLAATGTAGKNNKVKSLCQADASVTTGTAVLGFAIKVPAAIDIASYMFE